MKGRNIFVGYDLKSYPTIIEINNLDGVKYCTSPIMKNFLESMGIQTDILFLDEEGKMYDCSGELEVTIYDDVYGIKNFTELEKIFLKERRENVWTL